MENKEVEAIELAINLILEAVDELQTIKMLEEVQKSGTIHQA